MFTQLYSQPSFKVATIYVYTTETEAHKLGACMRENKTANIHTQSTVLHCVTCLAIVYRSGLAYHAFTMKGCL